MLLPLHVMLMELIIDPTCSVVLERQPAEHDVMEKPPRNPKESILSVSLLTKSVIQGMVIFAASFGAYWWFLEKKENSALARTMGLCVLILANLFLVQVNSAERQSVFTSARRFFKDKVIWVINLGTLACTALCLYTPLNAFLKLAPLDVPQILLAVGLSAVSVLWYEVVKFLKNR